MNVQLDFSRDHEHLPLLNSDANHILSVSVSRGSLSWFMAAGLIINAAMGAGLLNIAKAFDEAGGILISSVLHVVVIILVIGAYAILFACCDQSTSSYETFVLLKCGQTWQRICSVCIILYMYGLSITFFIIIGDQLDRCFYFAFGQTFCRHWYFDRRFTIPITSLLIIFPLSFSKSMKFLQIPSMLGVLAIIYVVIMVPVEYFTTHQPADIIIKHSPESWTDVFLVLPTMCFCYQAHVNSVPVFVSLKNRADCIKATLASMLVLIISYSLVAITGYLTFGTKVNHDILMSYPHSVAVLIAILMIALKTYVAYPVNLFCGRTAIESLSPESISIGPSRVQKRRIVVVSLWFFSTLVTAIFLPNISVAIHYLGALAASFIFIFPGLCLYFHITQNLFYSKKDILLIATAIFYVAVGVFVMAITLVQSLMSDIKGVKSDTANLC